MLAAALAAAVSSGATEVVADREERTVGAATTAAETGGGGDRVVSKQPAGDEGPGDGEGLTGLIARDLDGLSALTEPSPMARRAAAGREARRKASARRVSELARFRETQRGEFDALIADSAEEWGLCPWLFKGLLENESGLDADRVGRRIYRRVQGKRRAVGGGARGIAQFTKDGVAAVNEVRYRRHKRGERVRPFLPEQVMDPEHAIPASAELLASYIERFGRDGGVTAYNTGPGGGRRVARHGFYNARRTGGLSRHGKAHLQGHRFLINVLKKTNRLRKDADLPPLHYPKDTRWGIEKQLEKLLGDNS
jgi:hypothetical protein